MVFSRRAKRTVSRAVAVMLVMSMVTIGMAAPAPKALAAGTVLFNQPFHDNTVDGTAGSVSLPTAPTGDQRRVPVRRGQRDQEPAGQLRRPPTDAQGSASSASPQT